MSDTNQPGKARAIPAFLRNFIKDRLLVFLIRHSEYFDEKWYRSQANIPASVDAAAHYYRGGWKQYDPSPVFNQNIYLQINQDVRNVNICPLAHYLLHGRFENRGSSMNLEKNHYHAYRFPRACKRLWGRIRYSGLIRKNKNARILVIAHIYYEDSIDEIIEYLKNLDAYTYDLIVTTTETRNTKLIADRFREYKPETKVETYPNHGYDIGPFLEALHHIDLDRYDIVIKLQSKRHFPRKGKTSTNMFVRGRDWFVYLFESTVGVRWVHRNIDRLLHDPDTAVIAAENLIQEDLIHKQNLTLQLLEKAGLALDPGYRYVVGTCYAEKASSLKPLQALDITLKDFDSTERGYFSFAHAMERYMTGSLPASQLHGNNACLLRRKLNEFLGKKAMATRGLRLAYDPRFHLSDDFVLRFLENRTVYDYELTDIPAGDIYVRRSGYRIPLKDCPPYRFLLGEEEQYINYCLHLRRKDYATLSQEEYENEIRTNGAARYKALIEQLETEGYDPAYPIVVLDHHEIVDGQHRMCWLLHKYGDDHPVRVLKLRLDKEPKDGLPVITGQEAERVMSEAIRTEDMLAALRTNKAETADENNKTGSGPEREAASEQK